MIKKDIRPKNDNGLPHGYWEVYNGSDNTLWYTVNYSNGNFVGLRKRYDYGTLREMTYYII